MDQGTHAVLILATATLLAGAGIVVLALGWRRWYRGERSDMVLGEITSRQATLSLVAIPVVGLSVCLLIAVGAAALR